MRQVITEVALKEAIRQKTFIKDGLEQSCEGIKYDFTLSDYVLCPKDRHPFHLKEDTQHKGIIAPGEVAFVMSKESLELPGDMFCQLSAKRKLSLDGIIILGGLIIDPHYKGKLIFGLYNISSQDYALRPGKKLIAGVFFKMAESSEVSVPPEPINDFPDDIVKMISSYKPDSNIAALYDSVSSLKDEVKELKNKFANDENWKNDFKNGLRELKELVGEIGKQLSQEVIERKEAVHDLDKKYNEFGVFKKMIPPTWWIIATAIIFFVGVFTGNPQVVKTFLGIE